MNVLDEFQKAIEIERLKNLEDYEEQMKQPLDERIAKGITMSNLKVEFDFINVPISNMPNVRLFSSVRIICDNNISKFKEGSRVILSNGGYAFQLEVDEDSIDNFILKPDDYNFGSCTIDPNGYPKNNWEINATKTEVTSKLLLSAVQNLIDNNQMLNKIDSFLNGKTRNSYKSYSQKVDFLNKSQNSAYVNAINASDFCIIQGPPGTGKTETIGNIAKQLIESGLNIFITAPTNTAINNGLNAIASKVKDDSRVIKIGRKTDNKEVQKNPFIMKKLKLPYSSYLNNPIYSQRGIAIGATAYSICYPGNRKLDGWKFDVVIIDEASQLSIPLSIAAMCRADKYIFVGDHKQLDPIVPKKSNNEMFSESIFGRLARIYPNEINLLNTSYRLNESLIKIPNTLFYNNLLHSDSTTKQDNTQYQCNYHSQILNNDSHTLVLHNVFDAQGRSPFEAKLVAEMVADFLNNGVNIKDIGIMSPYRAQVREIKKEIKKILRNSIPNPFDTLFVDTVDSMQGQERNYIIYSFANSHPLESMRRLDFFYSPNRLNVAITRAIKKCIVISNYKVFDIIDEELQHHEEYQDIKESLDVFKKYYALSTKIEINETDNDEW
ncbi:MAG: AAA family ATPase [Chitinophagaceae bacterium]|nr:AAA family ATPase [Chitinophagaceae bacterium]